MTEYKFKTHNWIFDNVEYIEVNAEIIKKEAIEQINRDFKRDPNVYKVIEITLTLDPFESPYVRVWVKVLDHNKWYNGYNRCYNTTILTDSGKLCKIVIDVKEM